MARLLRRSKESLVEELERLHAYLEELGLPLDAEAAEGAGGSPTLGTVREQRDFVARVLDFAQTVVLILDREGRIVRYNRFFEELSGFPLEETVGKDWFTTFLAVDDRDRIERVFEQTKDLDATSGVINGIVTKSGEVRVIEWRNASLQDREGKVLGVLAVGEDITDRQKLVELERRDEAAARLRSVTASLPGVVFRMVREPGGVHRWLFLSDGVRRVFDVEPRAALDDFSLLEGRILPQDVGLWRQAIERSAERLEPLRVEVRVIGSDGRQKWLLTEAEVHRSSDGSTTWNGFVRDVSRSKETEKALERAERRWRGLLETAPDAMVMVAEEGTIAMVNAQTERLFGYSREELIGRPVECLVSEDLRSSHVEERMEFVKRPKARLMGSGRELLAVRKDGSELAVEVSLGPFETPDGLLISAAIRDVTERRRFERQLHDARQEAEKASEGKSRFLAAASHDLRQPLQAAHMYLSVLSTELGAEAPATLPKLRQCLDNLGELLSKLLDISRLDAGGVTPEKETFHVGGLLDRLVDELGPLAEEKGLEVRLVPTSVAIESDPQLLGQILQNLLTNAVRYTEEGRVLIGCRRRRQDLAVQVWDTGIGIPEEELEAVFEEFHQVSPVRASSGGAGARQQSQGLGLGLAIVSRLSGLLGHQLKVSSRVGRGSCFEIVIPRSDRLAPEREEEPLGEPQTGVLAVIDDDPDVLDALQLSLEVAGHDVSAGTDVETVISDLRARRQVPQLVLSDYRLAGGLTGVEAVERIRSEFGRPVPGILLTGETSLKEIQDAEARGFRVLFKPVPPEELERLLVQYLGAGA